MFLTRHGKPWSNPTAYTVKNALHGPFIGYVKLWVAHMRREKQERFPHHRLQRKHLLSDPGMHHDTYVTHVPWCMSGSLTRCGGENVPGIPVACATRKFTYLARGPWLCLFRFVLFPNTERVLIKYHRARWHFLSHYSSNDVLDSTPIFFSQRPIHNKSTQA